MSGHATKLPGQVIVVNEDKRGSKLLEGEWKAARAEETIRRNLERRRIREAAQRAPADEALRLFEHAKLYDGLGNAASAIAQYQEFLKLHTTKDETSAFVRERIEALSENLEESGNQASGESGA